MSHPVDLREATERVETFLAAKEDLDQRFPKTSQPHGRVTILGVYDHATGKYKNHELLVEDLRTLLDYLNNVDG